MFCRYFGFLALLISCGVTPLFSQTNIPDPVAFYRFECPDAGWLDYSSDETDRPFTSPPSTHSSWLTKVKSNGPVGNYLSRDDGGTVFFNYSTLGEWPVVIDDEEMTVEMLWKGGHRISRSSLFFFQGRVYWWLYADKMRVRAYLSGGGSQTFDIPLNGLGRLDPDYYYDENWHHFALVYTQDGTDPVINLYVDGHTIPEFHLELSQKLNDVNCNQFHVDFQEVLPISIDEVAVYDIALTDDEVYTHYLNFSNGEPYCYASCTLSSPPVLSSYIVARDPNEYPINYNPSSPPASSLDLVNISPFLDQVLSIPVPRYNPYSPLPRNHPFPGYLPYMNDDLSNNASGFPNVGKVFEEMETNFNNTFSMGALNEINDTILNNTGGANNAFQNLIKTLADHIVTENITHISSTTTWPLLPAANRNGPGLAYPNIARKGLTGKFYYTMDSDTSKYLTYFSSVGEVIIRDELPSFDGINLAAPTGPNSPFSMDGQFLSDNLADFELYTGQTMAFVMENGEEAPYALDFDDGKRLMEEEDINHEVNNGVLTLTSPGTKEKNGALKTSYDNFLNGNASTSELWTEYQSVRKNILRKSYRNALIGNRTGLNFWWYDVSGENAWKFEDMVDINDMSAVSSPSGQTVYPTPYYYPQTGILWFTGTGPKFGWRKLALDRQEELPLGYDFFAPAVAAGIQDASAYNVSDVDMTRPAQHLGYLKGMHMLGAEYFVNFLYNVSAGGDYHQIRLNGWQALTSSYAQAPTSLVRDLYYNSDPMEGDHGTVQPDAVLGAGAQYRFWGGSNNYLIAAREGSGTYLDQYLISGSIMNYLDDNEYPANYPHREFYNADATIDLQSGLSLTFPIRKQGSTYFFDNSDINAPVFYQLDGWHEYGHPERWSSDFEIEAECFEKNTPSIGTPVCTFETSTEGTDYAPIVDGDFRFFTTYMGLDQANSFSTADPQLDYGFYLRDFTAHNHRQVLIRARSRHEDTGVSINIPGIGSGNAYVQGSVWKWYDLGTFLFNSSERGYHVLELTPGNYELEIDKIVLIDSANANNYPTDTPATPVASLSGPGGLLCENAPYCFEVIRSAGNGAWAFSYTLNGVTDTVRNIKTDTHTVCLQLPVGNHTISLTDVMDENHPTGTVTGSDNFTIHSVPAVTLTHNGSSSSCNTSAVTLTATSGFDTYTWYRSGYEIPGATSSTLSVKTNGVYSVRAGDHGQCPGEASCVFLTFCLPSSKTAHNEQIEALRIHPNPTNGSFVLRGSLKHEARLEIELFSLRGEKLGSWGENASSGNFERRFDLEQYSQGIYLLSVRQGMEVRTFRIVRQ